MNAAAAESDEIGPGRLIALVGPSGAGKDTLLNGLRARLGGDPSYVFPRRIVTRSSSGSEDHDSLTPQAFRQAASDAAFAFWWEAHGNSYALPRSINDDIRAGRIVICNVSRAIVDRLRVTYRRVLVVLITAPATVLASRIEFRKRASDGDISQRLSRSELVGSVCADYVVDNCGTIDDGIELLAQAIARFAK